MEILLERIKELCKSRSMTVTNLEDKLDLPNNTIYQWKKRIPNTERLQKVADYFGVSIDYLLGRTDYPNTTNQNKKPQLTVEEAMASVMSRDGKPLSEHDQEILIGIIEAYIEKSKDE